MHVLLGGRDLAQAGDAARQAVDVGHGEIDPAFMGGGQKVKHGVGRAAHGDVQAHRIFERGKAGNRARQGGGVILFIPALGEIDDDMARFTEQSFAIGMGGERRTIAGQREAKRFGQAVHRIGREHARA